AVSLLLFTALLANVPSSANAARHDAFEIKGKAGSLGRLARVVVDDGAGYVSAARLAALVNGSWSVKDKKGTLMLGKRTAQFPLTRRGGGCAGDPQTLDAPARTGATGRLIPEDFLAKGLPRLAPGITAAAVPAELRTPPARATVPAEVRTPS